MRHYEDHGALEPAYILHHYPYRDSSWILELFTRTHGRIAVVARGGRRPNSKLRGILQPFQALLAAWFGRGELATLKSAEAASLSIKLSGKALLAGFYLNELIIRLLQRADPHPELFDSYSTTLDALASNPASFARTLRIFEKRLLQQLGYGLILAREADAETPISSDYNYRYVLEEGPRRAQAGEAAGIAVSGSALLSLEREEFDSEADLKEARGLLRATLDLYLGERPLKTRRVLRAMSARSTMRNNP